MRRQEQRKSHRWLPTTHQCCYLCDMFNLLNELHLPLQGKMTTVFRLIVNPERRCLKVMTDYHEIATTALIILLLFFDSLQWQQLKQIHRADFR